MFSSASRRSTTAHKNFTRGWATGALANCRIFWCRAIPKFCCAKPKARCSALSRRNETGAFDILPDAISIYAAAMTKRKTFPVALTIAGSDSGGGAGVQADLKTFAALGVHGTSAIACLTAQNPKRVLAVEPCSPKMLRQQIAAVFAELPPRAVKTGMLFSAENISVVAGFFKNKKLPLVVDPVMVSTSGARLLQPAAGKFLREKLLPLAL